MPNLLIVAPHFAPISAPDGQRVRMLLPHFGAFGWDAHVLSVDPQAAEAPLEPELLATLPPNQPVTRVPAWSVGKTRAIGLGNIAWRAWTALRRAGDRLLREHSFDLVYFSTTQFACLPLGRLWQRKWGVPFVIDLQDPWRTDYRHAANARPPGGWKYRFAVLQARWLEPWTLRHCAGVVAVSPAYLESLAARYPWWNPSTGRVVPMGWSETDFARAEASTDPATIARKIVRYIGRLGSDLQPSLDVLLAGLAHARARQAAADVQFEFVGGSYDPHTTETPVQAAAKRNGIVDAVTERPTRIPYLTALAALRSASANLILGSEDADYAPSKIWLVLASGRPWLALARPGTVLHGLLAPHVGPGGWIVDPLATSAAEDVARFCRTMERLGAGSCDRAALARVEARELTRQHADFFASLLISRP